MGRTSRLQEVGALRGVLTERDLPAAEDEFPGITDFFTQCPIKPRTFLELVFAFAESASPH